MLLLAIGLLLAATVPVLARTTIVPDDFPTIQAAVDHVENSGVPDTILIRSGHYAEQVLVRSDLVMMGIPPLVGPHEPPRIDGLQAGRGGGGQHYMFAGLHFTGPVIGGPTSGPDFLTLRNCQFDAGLTSDTVPEGTVTSLQGCTWTGRVLVTAAEIMVDSCTAYAPLNLYAQGQLFVRDSRFEGVMGTALDVVCDQEAYVSRNVVRGGGNGVVVRSNQFGTFVQDNRVEGCAGNGIRAISWDYEVLIERNHVADCGGIGISAEGDVLVRDNRVFRCAGTGMDLLHFEDLGTVQGNVVGGCGNGGLKLVAYEYSQSRELSLRNNTVFACGGPGYSLSDLTGGSVQNNIAAGNRGPGLLTARNGGLTLSCNDWFANDGGATDGIAPSASDLAVEPGFCDLARSDVQLMSNSPLLDAPGCGLIGALGKGCDPVPIALDLTPKTLNLASRGRWVTGYLQPAPPFAARDIDITTIRLNGTVSVDTTGPTALVDHDGDGINELMVKFDRATLELTLPDGDEVPVTVTCKAGTTTFAGADTLRVRRGRFVSPAGGAQMTAASAATASWETPAGGHVRSVALMFSADGGGTWNLIARSLSDNGSLAWTVPDARTDRARLAVVSMDSDKGNAEFTDAVLAVSGAFSIAASTDVGDRGDGSQVLAIRRVSPNPAQGRLAVEFVLRDASPARLELLDVAGRVLRTRDIASPTQGGRSLEFSDAAALRPGIYFLRLLQNGSEARARVAITR